MAAVAAQPVFRLLGAKDLGASDDYKTEKMPPVNVGLLDGQLAWRQHDGGHTDGPNWKYFIPWADGSSSARTRQRRRASIGRRSAGDARSPARRQAGAAHRCRTRCSRTSSCSQSARRGRSTSTSRAIRSRAAGARPTIRSSWRTGTQNFFGWNAADFGWGADRIENILWRVENGELDGVNPKVIVHRSPAPTTSARGRAATRRSPTSRAGIKALVDLCRAQGAAATIILTAIFPRNDNMAVIPEINAHQRELSRLRRRQIDSLPQRQRQARRQGRQAVRRHDERRQAASRRSRATRSGPTRSSRSLRSCSARPRRPIRRRRRPAIRAQRSREISRTRNSRYWRFPVTSTVVLRRKSADDDPTWRRTASGSTTQPCVSGFQ